MWKAIDDVFTHRRMLRDFIWVCRSSHGHMCVLLLERLWIGLLGRAWFVEMVNSLWM
jgi:hypothetical protein